MSHTRIFLFGKLRIHYGEHVTDGLGARKIEELFCYLLLQRNHNHTRELLADMFWGENPTDLSRKYLRKALWQLQSVLQAQPPRLPSNLLLVEPDWVQVNSQVDLWIDIAEFESVFDQTQRVPAEDMAPAHVRNVQDAVALYNGDLLEGCFHDWCLYERERLRHMQMSMLDKLARYAEMHHEYETGIAYATRILALDKAQERAHCQLMRLHYLIGDRTAALRQYERCVVALQEELGLPPAKLTQDLCAQIRADRLAEWPKSSQATGPRAKSWSQTTAILARLQKFQAELADLQLWAQGHIEEIELTLRSEPQD